MCPKIFSQGQSILSRKQVLMGRRLKKVRGAHLFHRGEKLEIFQSGARHDVPKLIRKVSPI